MTSPVLAPVEFYPPLVNPASPGLYGAVNWIENPGPARFLADGVRVRQVGNYGGSSAFGVWGADWCSPPGSDESEIKDGVRPDEADPFIPITVWAYDECDATPASRSEVLTRVQQILRLEEQTAVETSFAAQLLADAVGITATAETLAEAVGYLEGEMAKTNTTGQLHVSPALATPLAQEAWIVNPGGTSPRSVLGHRFVFGGGYVDGLGDVIVASSPTFGWRDEVQVRPVLEQQSNVYAAIAERSVVVGYERVVAAVQITGSSV